jgi:Domain of unknown function (DUF4160)
MPTVLRWRGYKFLFFSLDESEPPHVHVRKGSSEAKFWLADCQLAKSRGFPDHELRRVQRAIEERREELLRAWHEYFGA